MARRDRKQVNMTMIHIVTALLSIAVVCFLALVSYVTVLRFADRVEANRSTDSEIRNANKFVDAGDGVGRDAVRVFAIMGELPDDDTGHKKDDGGDEIKGYESIPVEAGKLPVINASVEINSISAVMIERNSGQIIYSVNPTRPQYPASLTKIMTTILGIELQEEMNKTITLTDEMFEGLTEASASVAGFVPGEEVRYIDLLYGIILPSGADAANAVAVTCGGSIEGFVEKMNEKAKELGMNSTNFVNPTGLHDVNMRTTAEDMMKLFSYALKNNTFKSIVSSRAYSTAATNRHANGLTFSSTMFDIIPVTEFENGAVIRGGKTGTTTPAGQCLASYATINDKEYILVTLGAYGYAGDEHMNTLDAMTLYSLVRTY